MNTFCRFLVCAVLIPGLSVNISRSMDHADSVSKTTQDVVYPITHKIVTPEYLLRKPWIRQILICASMIANFCR